MAKKKPTTTPAPSFPILDQCTELAQAREHERAASKLREERLAEVEAVCKAVEDAIGSRDSKGSVELQARKIARRLDQFCMTVQPEDRLEISLAD